MSQTFAELVEDVRQLSFAEREELQEIIKNSFIEERRQEIRENAEAGLEELHRGKLKSFSNVNELMDSLSHD
jgi:predicted transcriptional regulator